AVGYIEVQVYFHTAVMCVCRHCVPDAPRFQFGEPHLKLAGLDDAINKELADHPMVRIFLRPKFHGRSIGKCHLPDRIGSVCRSRVEVETGCARLCRMESYFFHPPSDVERFFVVERVLVAVGHHAGGVTDIDNTEFAAFQKEVGLKGIDWLKQKCLRRGDSSAYDKSVVKSINELDLVVREQVVD